MATLLLCSAGATDSKLPKLKAMNTPITIIRGCMNGLCFEYRRSNEDGKRLAKHLLDMAREAEVPLSMAVYKTITCIPNLKGITSDTLYCFNPLYRNQF